MKKYRFISVIEVEAENKVDALDKLELQLSHYSEYVLDPNTLQKTLLKIRDVITSLDKSSNTERLEEIEDIVNSSLGLDNIKD